MAQDPQAPPLADLMRELSNEMLQIHRWAAEQAGLNSTDLMAIYYVRNGEGQATPKSLADHLGLTSGATTILLNRLASRGYLVRKPHPTDRRGILLSLGPATENETFLNLRKRLVDVNAVVFNSLSPNEAEVVRRFIGMLMVNTRDALQAIRSGTTVLDKPETSADLFPAEKN